MSKTKGPNEQLEAVKLPVGLRMPGRDKETEPRISWQSASLAPIKEGSSTIPMKFSCEERQKVFPRVRGIFRSVDNINR